MPASYTHFRFGRDVLSLLPPERKHSALLHRGLFDIGLHGPDIFFFYQPYRSNPISALGYRMHGETGRQVFHRLQLLRDKLASAEAQAYLAGFLCHFVLDTVCHPYIDHITASTPISHTRLEMELDRAFLVRDGLDPLRQPLAGHIRPTAGNTAVIASLIPDVTAHQVEQALKQMIAYDRLLLAPGKPKRTALNGVFRLIGQEEAFGGRIMSVQPRAACVPMAARLQQHYDKALPLAVELLLQLPDLSHPQFSLDFGGVSPEVV